VLQAIREDERTQDVPVLVLSAKTMIEDQRRCWQMGADWFLTKPFSPQDLSDAVAVVMAADQPERVARRDEALEALRP
jgi:two-component system, OmpR family, phosphate regulon response regulator PhoB